MRIQALLADDSRTELDVLCYLIRKYDLPLDAVTAGDGEEALRRLQEAPFDLLITDIRMPFLDGLSLAKEALALHPQLKIVISSGYQDFAYARTAISLGVEEYLLKPVVPDQFCQLVRRLAEEIEVEGRKRREDQLKLLFSRNQITLQLLSGKLAAQPGGGLPPEVRALMPENGILVFLSCEQASRSTLDHLKNELVQLAERIFLSPVRLLSLEDGLLFSIDAIAPAYEEDGSLLASQAESFCERITQMYQLSAAVTAESFLGPEEIPEVARRLRANAAPRRQASEEGGADLTLPHGKVRFLCDYIAAHYQENLSLEVLASVSYLNSDYLCRVFKKETGVNLMKYIKTFRMNKACQLLESTQQKVTAISQAVGYQNCAYFIHTFTDLFGVSPEKYRQQHQKGGEG